VRSPITKRVKAATPTLTCAARAAATFGSADQPQHRRGWRTKNIENNPMQGSPAAAGMGDPATTI